MNGLVLDTSALLAYAGGGHDEPGGLISLAGEDPRQSVWVPVLCLLRAYDLTALDPAAGALLDLLVAGPVLVEELTADGARRAGRDAGRLGLGADTAQAVRTAALYRAHMVTASDDTIAACPPKMTVLDIRDTF